MEPQPEGFGLGSLDWSGDGPKRRRFACCARWYTFRVASFGGHGNRKSAALRTIEGILASQ